VERELEVAVLGDDGLVHLRRRPCPIRFASSSCCCRRPLSKATEPAGTDGRVEIPLGARAVRSFVPSGNVPSTWTSPTVSGTPGSVWRRPRSFWPARRGTRSAAASSEEYPRGRSRRQPARRISTSRPRRHRDDAPPTPPAPRGRVLPREPKFRTRFATRLPARGHELRDAHAVADLLEHDRRDEGHLRERIGARPVRRPRIAGRGGVRAIGRRSSGSRPRSDAPRPVSADGHRGLAANPVRSAARGGAARSRSEPSKNARRVPAGVSRRDRATPGPTQPRDNWPNVSSSRAARSRPRAGSISSRARGAAARARPPGGAANDRSRAASGACRGLRGGRAAGCGGQRGEAPFGRD